MKQTFSLALVTGAGGGIGRAIAKELDRRGCSLILVGRRFSTLEETADLLSKRPLCIEADLSDPAQCERVFEQVKTMPVDLAVNNAGFGLCGDFTETDEAREFSMLDLNVRAVQFFTKRFVRLFAEKDCGAVLNVASSAAFLPGTGMAVYYATKAYILRLSEGISGELKRNKSRVSVSVLCPGPVNTDFSDTARVRFSSRGISAEKAAKAAVKGAARGKLIIVPGASMKCIRFFERFFPERALVWFTGKFQKRNEKANRRNPS